MTKRMLIDDTQPEETRVVIVDGNKVEDVEFESCLRKQIKGNIYTAKVIRVEPSLQAAFIDYGGNKHGFLAFGEIHPDYYHISPELAEAVEKEADEIIERRKQILKEKEEHRERVRAEKKALYEARLREQELQNAQHQAQEGYEEKNEVQSPEDQKQTAAEETAISQASESQTIFDANASEEKTNTDTSKEVTTSETMATNQAEQQINAEFSDTQNSQNVSESEQPQETPAKPKRKYTRRKKKAEPITQDQPAGIETSEEKISVSANDQNSENVADQVLESPKTRRKKKTKVLADDTGSSDPVISETNNESEPDCDNEDEDNETFIDNDEEDSEEDFEIQRKLIRARKLYHACSIQDVIKEGQTLLIQIVKEERGNKGAACTTYLSLAGRYCVLMPNRIKSGGVSRKITNATDRKRLKDIMKTLPLSADMSMIIRTAGEGQSKAEIVRDYNYLIRTWNQIRLGALKNNVPSLIYEEGNLIKRALRDMYTKDISEVIVDGNEAFKAARDFVKILSPHNVKKIKCRRDNEMPVFQRFQIEPQLDKLHNPVVSLESGGYLVINPTEALVSIDVNSGKATKEKDIEETALKTNLEAADEIARQLKMRDLAGLVVVDFIDMDEPKNNLAVEKRMKEALKNDRARIQIAKMSCFGLLEISRQRMHSSFLESNYEPCPFCHGQGVVRTTESGAILILRAIEEEGTKNRSSRVTVFVPTETAIYLLNQKRKNLTDLEERYKMNIIISADNEIKNISDYRLERQKNAKTPEAETKEVPATTYATFDTLEEEINNSQAEETPNEGNNNSDLKKFHQRRSRFDRRFRSRKDNRNNKPVNDETSLAFSGAPNKNYSEQSDKPDTKTQEVKKAWWRRLIG